MIDYWLEMDNGAMYKGEISFANGKPDGRGLKIYKGESLHEGWYLNG